MDLQLDGDRIRELRREAGLSRTELAYQVGVTEGTLQKWEAGTRVHARSDRLVRLAQALGVQPDALLREPASA